MTNEEIGSRVKFLLHDLREEFPHFEDIFGLLVEWTSKKSFFKSERQRLVKIACLLFMLHDGLRLKFCPKDGFMFTQPDGEPVRTAFSMDSGDFAENLLADLSNNSGYLQRTDRICPTVNKGTILSLVTGAVSPVQPDLSGLFKYLESRGVEVEE